jgi:hypothetical protein
MAASRATAKMTVVVLSPPHREVLQAGNFVTPAGLIAPHLWQDRSAMPRPFLISTYDNPLRRDHRCKYVEIFRSTSTALSSPMSPSFMP